ncbi:CaiB/BaiF CoA transferase family protein [Desulfospira joergensenii]|uniref:CaiB/BaiF CoA transferase family protein n=1 Tax=Desulfospira joergensenii TaxID=53329 RepID=UPI0003B4E426|nr:CoA transferase [Desulfospira joergensenii]
MEDKKSKGALNGIRVLDLSRVLAGPFCTMLLGDMGAEIIKIEVPGHGDDSRRYPPFIKEESAYFMNLNRNKKSLVLNLKEEQGKKILLDLVKKSHVILENFRPGTMEKLGLGYETIKAHNPDIIYSCISGFGHSGLYKDLPGYDIIGQAMGGIMSITGWPDSPPTRTGTAIGDVLGGLCSCIGILTSLMGVRNGHPGQKVDISLVDSVVSAMETIIQIYLVENRIPERTGNRYEFIYPYDTFKAKDGWVIIAVGNNKLWEIFCKAIERTDLLGDDSLKDNYDRVKVHEKIKKIVEEWTGDKDVKDIIEFFQSKQIPCAPVYTVKDVVEDPHIARARKMIRDVDHPVAGPMKCIGSPVNLSETPAQIHSPAPLLGQHTESVLKEILDMDEDRISDLKLRKIISGTGT